MSVARGGNSHRSSDGPYFPQRARSELPPHQYNLRQLLVIVSFLTTGRLNVACFPAASMLPVTYRSFARSAGVTFLYVDAVVTRKRE